MTKIINLIKGKLEQIIRLIFVNSVTIFNKSIIIVEYPKSGGTWLGQLVSEYFEIPFPRNRFPILKQSVFHSHYLPKYFLCRNKRILWLIRDGRDVNVSYYYHQLIWSDKNKLDPKTVTYTRKQLKFKDYDSIEENLPDYIDYSFKHKPSKFHYFNFPGNWKTFNLKWLKSYNKRKDNIYFIRYEDLLENTEQELVKMISNFFKVEVNEQKIKKTVKKYSFESQTHRKRGEENKKSFLRKGIAGDWKNKFNQEAKERYKENAGDALIQFKYEQDLNW